MYVLNFQFLCKGFCGLWMLCDVRRFWRITTILDFVDFVLYENVHGGFRIESSRFLLCCLCEKKKL